jgi:hypothetical protein
MEVFFAETEGDVVDDLGFSVGEELVVGPISGERGDLGVIKFTRD